MEKGYSIEEVYAADSDYIISYGDGGDLGWYISISYRDDIGEEQTLYVRDDGLAYESCGSHGFFSTEQEAIDRVNEFEKGGKVVSIVTFKKDGKITGRSEEWVRLGLKGNSVLLTS